MSRSGWDVCCQGLYEFQFSLLHCPIRRCPGTSAGSFKSGQNVPVLIVKKENNPVKKFCAAAIRYKCHLTFSAKLRVNSRPVYRIILRITGSILNVFLDSGIKVRVSRNWDRVLVKVPKEVSAETASDTCRAFREYTPSARCSPSPTRRLRTF